MSLQKVLVTVVTLAFAVLTGVAGWQHGYTGVFMRCFDNSATTQVLVDLVIMGAFTGGWMYRDARRRGTSPWPWLAVLAVAGSFGPLLWFLVRDQLGSVQSAEPSSR